MSACRPKRAGIWENLGRSMVDLERRAQRNVALWHASPRRSERLLLVSSSLIALLLLVMLIVLLTLRASWPVPLPEVLAVPETAVLIAILALAFSLRTHLDARRSIAYYRRFMRPGLRRLLHSDGESLRRGEKLFRSRGTVIMKVDIAGFTRDTFPMPYGMRRLFVDLWFTLIDQVVADQVFFDKSLGDGSFYCFERELPGGSCHAALKAALAIRDWQVPVFDATFRRLLRERLEASDELRVHAERFLADYETTNETSFWERRTQARIALVSGYVDEGLWGLSSQSHYDIQGNLPILATRLEQAGRGGEIVFDDDFLEELELEAPGKLDHALLKRRVAPLKGIGLREVLVVRPGVDPYK